MGAALATAGAAALLAAACASRSASPSGPRVVLRSAGREHVVRVELARTDAERERGLMFRERLEPDHGMLFLFDSDDEHVFWMKNTLVPLDLIFIDSAGRVVGVVANADPLSLAPRTVGAPSRSVLEVPGGWAAAHGVRPGDEVRGEGSGLERWPATSGGDAGAPAPPSGRGSPP